MKILEYQAKELLASYKVPVPDGRVAFSSVEAQQAAETIGGEKWMVKAQIHAGGRGRGGAVEEASSATEAGKLAGALLGRRIVTTQTDATGQTPKSVYVEAFAHVASEHYLSVLVDNNASQIVVIASRLGGERIEEDARENLSIIEKIALKEFSQVSADEAQRAASALGLPDDKQSEAIGLVRSLHRALLDYDATLIEINPLVVTKAGEMSALDVKMIIDDNAMFRHADLERLRDPDAGNVLERWKHGFNFVQLDGDIGCLVTGAGLALATMDLIKHRGGEPANFLDLPPATTRLEIAEACKLILSNPAVKVVLVNAMGGGVTNCHLVAEGVVTAALEAKPSVPIVVCFAGISTEAGYMILKHSRVDFVTAATVSDAVDIAVKTAKSA